MIRRHVIVGEAGVLKSRYGSPDTMTPRELGLLEFMRPGVLYTKHEISRGLGLDLTSVTEYTRRLQGKGLVKIYCCRCVRKGGCGYLVYVLVRGGVNN